jgi:pSer/pThr/pTyr-binding forkhead associated (FHA) protein
MSTRLSLRVLGSRLRGSEFVLEAPSVCKIGRAEECELRLPASWDYLDVSRRHCVIEVQPSGASVRDLGSRNGTYLNGAAIGKRNKKLLFEATPAELPHYELRDGDELRVGATVFRVELSYDDTESLGGLEPVTWAGSACPLLN